MTYSENFVYWAIRDLAPNSTFVLRDENNLDIEWLSHGEGETVPTNSQIEEKAEELRLAYENRHSILQSLIDSVSTKFANIGFSEQEIKFILSDNKNDS